MEKRKLGKSELLVSPLMFGGNVFGWTINEPESFKILDSFADGGFNFIDTADTYSRWVPGNHGGESETIIGNWMKKNGKRNEVLIATKLGGDVGKGKKDLSAGYVKQAAEASLKRLQTDHIDLYQTHYDDVDTPVEETMTALNLLIKEGKVRYIGTSNLSAARIKESNNFAGKNNLQPYISLQPLYNLYDRQKFEHEYLKLVTDEGLAVLPYYALASGFLSGKYRVKEDLQKSPRGEGIGKKYFNERGNTILKAMDKVAAGQKVPLSEVAIAWLLQKPFVTSAIVSATNQKQLNELINATNLKLDNQQMEELDESGFY